MNAALLIAACAGFAFAAYAWFMPHWPNPAAARLAWEAAKLMRCPHRAYHWSIERTGQGWMLVGCAACARDRRPTI